MSYCIASLSNRHLLFLSGWISVTKPVVFTRSVCVSSMNQAKQYETEADAAEDLIKMKLAEKEGREWQVIEYNQTLAEHHRNKLALKNEYRQRYRR